MFSFTKGRCITVNACLRVEGEVSNLTLVWVSAESQLVCNWTFLPQARHPQKLSSGIFAPCLRVRASLRGILAKFDETCCIYTSDRHQQSTEEQNQLLSECKFSQFITDKS